MPPSATLDYKVLGWLGPGSVVECSRLLPRTVIGIVWEAERLPGTEVPAEKLRNLRGVLPVPPLSAALRRLIEWTADYYVASLASVARMALSSGGALEGPATMTEYRLTGGLPERMTPQRQAAIDALEGEQANIRELVRASPGFPKACCAGWSTRACSNRSRSIATGPRPRAPISSRSR